MESARTYKLDIPAQNDTLWLSKVLNTEKQFRPFLSDGDLEKFSMLTKVVYLNLFNPFRSMKRGDRSYLFDFAGYRHDVLVAKMKVSVIEDLENNESGIVFWRHFLTGFM